MTLVATTRIPCPGTKTGFVEPGQPVPDSLDGDALIRKGAASDGGERAVCDGCPAADRVAELEAALVAAEEERDEALAKVLAVAEGIEALGDGAPAEVAALANVLADLPEVSEDLNQAQLLEIAEQENVDGVNGRSSKAVIVAAILAKRGEQPPTS